MMSGKWNAAGVPQKGWTCEAVDDLGAPEMTCEMCETQEIRYVHTMTHPDYRDALQVGCICAEHMENDYVGPRLREKALRSAAGRRQRWLTRHWQTSTKGNPYLNVDGFNIAVSQNANGTWGGRILERSTGRSVSARKQHPNEAAAKLAAFDAMVFLKTKKGWG